MIITPPNPPHGPPELIRQLSTRHRQRFTMISFHGGCHGCTQQYEHSTDFCFDCCYFAPDWSKPDLNNRPPNEAEIERQKVISRRTQSPLLVPARLKGLLTGGA